jgi:hypothetical protein
LCKIFLIIRKIDKQIDKDNIYFDEERDGERFVLMQPHLVRLVDISPQVLHVGIVLCLFPCFA